MHSLHTIQVVVELLFVQLFIYFLNVFSFLIRKAGRTLKNIFAYF